MRTYKISAAAMLLMVSLVVGCGFKDQRVSLTYDTLGGAAGAGGEIFIERPRERQTDKTPVGARILGRVNGTEGAVVTGDSVDAWFLNALEKELSASGYRVRTVSELPEKAARGLKPSVLNVSADQTLSLFTAATTIRLKLSVEVWKEGRLVKIVSVSAGNEDKGIDHSAGHLSSLLTNTLQNAMKNIVPDLMKALDG